MCNDRLSNIIYKYKCETCNILYIDSSIKQSKTRFTQHLGVSFRTNRQLSKSTYSTSSLHLETHNYPMAVNRFSIIDKAPNSLSLRTLESIYVAELKPQMNKDKAAESLFIVE